MSKWKPGQLVTIDNKVYRICKAPGDFYVCNRCAFAKSIRDAINNLLGVRCSNACLCGNIREQDMAFSYFKQVYPKT